MIYSARKMSIRVPLALVIFATALFVNPVLAQNNPPNNLTATTQSSTSIKLDWNDRSSNENGFEIWRSTTANINPGTNGTLIATVGTSVETYTDTGLTPGTTYYYKVRYYRTNGFKSNFSSEASATTNSVSSSSSSSSSSSGASSSSSSSSSTSGGDLNLANTALEVMYPVEPNIVLLTDDSGSMDEGLMSLGPDAGGDGELKYGGRLYSYAHPDPGSSGDPPAVNRYDRETAPTEEYLRDVQGVSYPYYGTWRAWNKDYNKVYYNGDVTYNPWLGVNSAGTAYTDATPTAAWYDPFRPGNGTINLTASTGDYPSHFSTVGNITATGFYAARYYTWDDSNSTTAANANNGSVDSDDDHTLYEIRAAADLTCSAGATCPTTFTRSNSRTDCATDNGDGTVTCSQTEELQNFANWFSFYRKRDLVAKANLSSVVANNTTARIGFATIHNNDSVNIRVSNMNISPSSGNKKALLDEIFDMNPNSGTPLRQNLEKTGKYFQCASGDIYGSSASSNPGDSNCPIYTLSNGGACQQNFTVLMTDGFYNGTAPSLGNTDKNTGAASNPDFDGGAFEDNNSNTLADVAMYYYETDLHADSVLPDSVPATSNDQNRYPLATGYPSDSEGDPSNMHQHMATYTISFGVTGSLTAMPTDPTAVFAWPDPSASNTAKIDDLRHAAYNGRGDYYSSVDPQALSDALTEIFSQIGEAEGAASAVAFNTQNIDSGSLVFRAFFNTKTNSGDLVAHKVSLNGVIDTSVEEWSASDELHSAVPSNRIIFTYKDTGATSAGAPFRWASLTTGSGSQQEQLDQPVPSNVSNVGDERLDWLRGDTSDEGDNFNDGEFRERVLASGKKELLGDIVHSAPVFVGSPPFSGRDSAPYPTDAADLYSQYKLDNTGRNELVFVGANDGMLHAFDAADGSEKFAYVPNAVFSNLASLTDPDYSHQYYVDLTPSINDAYTKVSSTGSKGWRTVLVGGLAKGGKGYYALNVSDPASFVDEASSAANVMWEFTSTDDDVLGYSFSQPLIAMSNVDDGTTKKWVAIFGNGYNSSNADGDAALFILDLEGGLDGVWSVSDYKKISTNNGRAESGTNTPNGISGIRGIDSDQNGTVDYVYAGDLQGNLYRFDLTDTSSIGNFDLDGLLYKARYDSTGPVQPITNAPIVIQHPESSGYIVIAGTGSWMTTEDRLDTSIQSIYGIWDDLGSLSTSSADVVFSELTEQQFINHATQEEGFTVRTSTNNTITWKNTGSSRKMGWYINFDMASADGSANPEFAGERAIRRFHFRGGLLFVNTVIPKSGDVCESTAGGYELGFCPETGGSCDNIIFDLNNDGVFDIKDNVGDFEGANVIVTGKRFDDSTPADSSFIGDTQVTQTSDKSIRTSRTNTKKDGLEGRHSWREIEP